MVKCFLKPNRQSKKKVRDAVCTRVSLSSCSITIIDPLLLTMKAASKFAIVLVTAPSLKVARQLSKSALEKRLVACANLIPKIESHYWWQGKLEKSAEVLVIMKSTKPN